MHQYENVRQIQLKKTGHSTPWDITSYINICWDYLYDLTKKLEARDITTSGDENVRVDVDQMWESDYFTEEIMIKWEKNATGKKTWANVKIDFGKLYQDLTQFLRSTAGKRSKFYRANSKKEEASGGEK